MPTQVLNEKIDEITILTLNDPEYRNALGSQMQEELLEQLEQAAKDADCKAVVLTGAQGNFSSGGNINNMKEERSLAVSREKVAFFAKISRALIAGPKPVIAAVEGYAVGGGFSVASGCDYLISSSSAVFMTAFSKMGILPDLGLLWSLTQRVGIGPAKRIIASGCKVTAEEGFRLGLVDQLAEPGCALESAIVVAKEFAQGAPLPMAMMKTAFARGIAGLEDALQFELDNQPVLYASKDHREAVSAFFEKRRPNFKGH